MNGVRSGVEGKAEAEGLSLAQNSANKKTTRKELALMSKVAKSLERLANTLEHNTLLDLTEITYAILKTRYKRVSDIMLSERFGITKDQALYFLEKVIYAIDYKEEEGIDLGIGLYFSEETNYYYHFSSNYKDLKFKVSVQRYSAEDLKNWLEVVL